MGSTGWTQTGSDRVVPVVAFCVGSIARARQTSLRDTKQALRCGSEVRLPFNGFSSFRSRDVEHRHYVVCRRVRRSWPPYRGTKTDWETGQEYARGSSQTKGFPNANFIPFPSPPFANHSHSDSSELVSLFFSPSSSFLFFFLFFFSFRLACFLFSRTSVSTIPRDSLRVVGQYQTWYYRQFFAARRVSQRRVSPWRGGKNTTQGERVNEFRRVASYRSTSWDERTPPTPSSLSGNDDSQAEASRERRNNAVRAMHDQRINEIRSRIVN